MTVLLTRGERVSLIFDEACRLWSVERHELLGARQFGVLTAPRCAVVLALRDMPAPKLSYPTIGRHLGRRHHTSAIHLAVRGREMARQSPGFAAALDRLKAIARGEIQ